MADGARPGRRGGVSQTDGMMIANANQGTADPMAVTVSVVLLLFVMAVIFLRSGRLRVSHAVVCILLGFYLASSTAAPTIQSGLDATAEVVSSIRP